MDLIKKHQVCTCEDDFTNSRYEGESRWICSLNSGITVWQDDDRPDTDPLSAWIRLGNYCRDSGDFITGMTIQFRSHTESLPANKDGYYFVKSVLGSMARDETFHFFVCGYVENGIIKVTEYKVPELVAVTSEDREIKEGDICLIMSPQLTGKNVHQHNI